MSANLKILHLSSERSWRGGEQQIAYLIDELSLLGVTNFVAVRKNSVFESYVSGKNLSYISLPFLNTMDFITAIAIKKFCKVNGIDLIHIHSARSHGIAALSALLGNRTPMILSRRVDFVPNASVVTRWRYNHPCVRRIACVSDMITDIMKRYVNNPSICLTIHSGIDTSKFSAHLSSTILRKEYNVPHEFTVIGNTSALEGHKDYFTFIRTIKKLKERKFPARAFIIGEGSLKVKLMEQVRKEDLQDMIFFTGFRKDITLVLPSLDIFLITSETEGLGTSVLDAFAARVPVVATAAGGIPEMIEHRVTGMLHPVKDADGLAMSIIELTKNTSLKKQLIENAAAKLKGFSKRATAQKTLNLYKEVLRELQN